MVRKMQLSQYQNATRDFAVRFIREPVEALTPHVHDYYQLYYVTEGELRHHLDGGSRDMAAAIEKCDPVDFHYTELPDAEHDVWNYTYKNAEIMKWLFSQKKS